MLFKIMADGTIMHTEIQQLQLKPGVHNKFCSDRALLLNVASQLANPNSSQLSSNVQNPCRSSCHAKVATDTGTVTVNTCNMYRPQFSLDSLIDIVQFCKILPFSVDQGKTPHLLACANIFICSLYRECHFWACGPLVACYSYFTYIPHVTAIFTCFDDVENPLSPLFSQLLRSTVSAWSVKPF